METMASSRTTERPSEPEKDINGRNIKHCRAPEYAPFGDYQNPVLYKNAYEPRALLNYTVAAFHDRSDVELSERQLEARKAFVDHFKERKAAYGIKVRTAGPLKSFQDDVLRFFEYIDVFFFFGLLWEDVHIKSGLQIVGRPLKGLVDTTTGMTYACTERDPAYIQIDMNIGSYSSLYQLGFVIGILLHEMVHAYLMIYGCDCLSCDKNALNTVGVDHHGPIFLMLHRLILTELRRWGVISGDEDLALLEVADCPGDSMSLEAREQNSYAMAEMEIAEETWARRQQNPNYIIRFSSNGEGVVVDHSRLRDGQIKMENYLRSRWEAESTFM
ncbi:uncharacterized protein F4807DRAFT_409252 [Annulohypoxylon truncatum]|uniref:uncharacterized protein n=1 Tax=Annulohypoxylon truncatum TaxID=327061 RepID=UPI002008CC99|nr:uncharacterized protein F4807DRAFT_409252 [Annulohypoxylon truncatum]KAI1213819.1 hypothetical protein F4807DRAFT_409252 [Annulohypoxylon truncatum]